MGGGLCPSHLVTTVQSASAAHFAAAVEYFRVITRLGHNSFCLLEQ